MASSATNNGSGVEVVDRAKPAPAEENTTETEVARSLSRRLAEVRAEAFGIGKDNIKMSYTDKKSGERKEFTIKGHTMEAVLAELRPLFDAAEVFCFPNLVERVYSGNRCDVIVDFEWENLDDPSDRRTIRWAGSGTDDGDKAFSKAGTNALKEHLKKLFLVTDRDDAKEEEEKVEHRTDEGIRRADVERAKDQARANLQQWATTFKAALENAPNLDDVKRLERENREQLTSEELPSVTRTFFVELIEERKAALA